MVSCHAKILKVQLKVLPIKAKSEWDVNLVTILSFFLVYCYFDNFLEA